MSDQPSSQDSIGTQEIYSQGSFDEIWQTLGRTFSNPEKLVQGVLTEEIPTVIEYKDELERDKFEIIYQQRTLRNACLPNSQQVLDIDLQPYPQTPISTTSNGCTTNGQLPLINGNLHHPFPVSPMSPIDHICLPSILPNTSYPGKYDFSISFEPNNGPITKATPWVYQQETHKLFVKMQCVCPILFKMQGTPPPGSVVRGILTYKRPEHYKDVVIRCPNHKNTCKDGHPYQDHVMRCENSSTRYESCPSTRRLSLVIPLKATSIVVGEGYFKELFKFTCFNSCVGGMNRRPTNLLFRLECGGEVFARCIVEVRICASPGRDCNEKDSVGAQKGADKRNGHEPSSTNDMLISRPLSPAVSSTTATSPTSNQPRPTVLMSAKTDDTCVLQAPFFRPSKRSCTSTNGVVLTKAKRTCLADPTDEEKFTLTIVGRERYEMLLKIKEGLELLDGIRRTETNQARCGETDTPQSPEFTKIKPKLPPVQVKREEGQNAEVEREEGQNAEVTMDSYTETDIPRSPEFPRIKPKPPPVHVMREGQNAECLSQSSTSPQSSQENSALSLSQLSRTSSTASSQSSSARATEEYCAWQVTLKRTLSIDKPSRSRSGCP